MLAGDILPWERQPDETEPAYAAFHADLHSERRKVTDHGPTAKDWSARYRWSMRAHEWDLYMSRVDLEEQVRYRRRMLERHRRVGAVAQGKAVEWLNTLTPERIAKMSVADATRLLDVAVRIEREACPAVGAEDLPDDPYREPPRENGLQQRLIEAGLDVELSEIADLLHKLDRPAASVSELPPQADDRPAPLGPQPGEDSEPPGQGDIFSPQWRPYGGADVNGGPR
jgi:hypothetical protein